LLSILISCFIIKHRNPLLCTAARQHILVVMEFAQ
jgi:hypothetical protein